jgi:hypothetical protein
MSYETSKITSDLTDLRELRDHTAWESVLASIAADRVQAARDAGARYWEAYTRENRREK